MIRPGCDCAAPLFPCETGWYCQHCGQEYVRLESESRPAVVRLVPVDDAKPDEDWATAHESKRKQRLPDDTLLRGMSCPGCEAYWAVGELGAARLRISFISDRPVGSCAKCADLPETD